MSKKLAHSGFAPMRWFKVQCSTFNVFRTDFPLILSIAPFVRSTLRLRATAQLFETKNPT
jgi:hypothetical protein